MISPSTAIPALAPETLRSWVTEHQDLMIIDVRSAAEFESVHIRGSYNVPLPLLSEHTDELAARLGSRVVLVCQSGARAEQARQRLGSSGVNTAYVLTGGVPGFAAAGGDVVKGKERWDLERQVRLAAGSLVVLGLAGGKFVSPQDPDACRRHRRRPDLFRRDQHLRHGQGPLGHAVEQVRPRSPRAKPPS